MNSLEYIFQFALLHASMRACCDLIKKESDEIIARMPKHQQKYAPVQLSLSDKDNETVQLWYTIHTAQMKLIKERELNVD